MLRLLQDVLRSSQSTRAVTEPADAAQVGSAIAVLWDQFKSTNLNRVSALEAAALALLENRLADEQRASAEREAHKLAGAVGSFGFSAASDLAREAEHLLARTLDPVDALRLSELAIQLRAQLQAPPAASDIAAPPADVPTLLIVSDDAEWSDRAIAEATARGVRARRSALSAAVATIEPSPAGCAVILDIGDAGPEDEHLLKLVADFGQADPPVSIVVLAERSSLALRLEVVRRGAGAFLQKPVSPVRAISAVRRILQPTLGSSKLLVVDDDPQVLAVLDRVLEPAGMHVTSLEDPRMFWDTFQNLRPDLLILDVDMDGIDGIDLCRVVRTDARGQSLPIVFLTAHRDEATIERLFRAGADDYVPKPIRGSELLTRLRNQLERHPAENSLLDVDPVTGLRSRRAATLQVDALLRVADRQRQPVSVAFLALSPIEDPASCKVGIGDGLVRQFGRTLQAYFRPDAVLASWDGDQFLIAQYGWTRDDLLHQLQEVLAELDATRVSLSAGVAQAPHDGTTLDALTSAARSRLRILRDNSTDDGSVEVCDVVIVDDDESITALLHEAVCARGYSTRWIADGAAALEALRGPAPRVRARTLLLDVNLPGMDGLSVLRQLGRSGTLEHTKVIVLTLRSSETETREALALGAFDHIAKPFSVSILLERLQRALTA